MPYNLTAKMKRNFDHLRTVTGLPTDLVCVRATATGYTAVSGSPISGGWFAENLLDNQTQDAPSTGEHYLQILIAEHSGWATSMMDSLVAVVIGTKRHKVNVILPPNGEPNVWLLKADPTGETV